MKRRLVERLAGARVLAVEGSKPNPKSDPTLADLPLVKALLEGLGEAEGARR